MTRHQRRSPGLCVQPTLWEAADQRSPVGIETAWGDAPDAQDEPDDPRSQDPVHSVPPDTTADGTPSDRRRHRTPSFVCEVPLRVTPHDERVLLEKVSYYAWQRRVGRSIQRHAPGLFVARLTRLAESAGGKLLQVPTWQTKLSQTCQCGQVKKKPLSLRVHHGEHCGVQMQRDLYSAYLIQFIDPDTHLLHIDQAQAAWPRWEPIGRAAWQQAHPTNQPASEGATVRLRRSFSVGRRKAVRASELVARDRPANQAQGSGGVAQGDLARAGQRRR